MELNSMWDKELEHSAHIQESLPNTSVPDPWNFGVDPDPGIQASD